MNQRAQLAALMDASVHNAANWHYGFYRPETSNYTADQLAHGRTSLDCSMGFITLCRVVGLPDPSGNNFDAYGNSSDIWSHLPHVATAAELDIGDAVIFGVNGSHHISAVRIPGPDPLLWSNGSEAAPAFYRLSQERVWQPTPVTFAMISAPPSVPPHPPVDPFWEWLRWNLGEGEFHGHKQDPHLRPALAPKRIPQTWWRRRERFLKKRQKPPQGTSIVTPGTT